MTSSSKATHSQARRALREGRAEQAFEMLSSLGVHQPGNLQLLSLKAQAAAELGRWEAALDCTDQITRLAPTEDAGRVESAQILVAAGRRREAREMLQPLLDVNIVANGMHSILSSFLNVEEFDGETTSAPLTLDASALWFEPVLTLLLFELETQLRRNPPSDPADWSRRQAVLVRPHLEPEIFQSPKPGVVESILERFGSVSSRERKRCERLVIGHFFRGDLGAAGQALEAWLQESPDAYGSSANDPRRSLLLETYFSMGRLDPEYIELYAKAADSEELDTSHHLMAAYACMRSATKKVEAREILTQRCLSDSFSAAAAHLMALCEWPSNGATFAWFRRGVRADDITMVELAQIQLEALGTKLS